MEYPFFTGEISSTHREQLTGSHREGREEREELQPQKHRNTEGSLRATGITPQRSFFKV